MVDTILSSFRPMPHLDLGRAASAEPRLEDGIYEQIFNYQKVAARLLRRNKTGRAGFGAR
jgi:hypothetical protein